MSLYPGDRLIYRGLELNTSILDAILNTDVRILWAFETDGKGGVVVVPHDESQCIWMSGKDVLQTEDVEL